jgi:hypothetical protein
MDIVRKTGHHQHVSPVPCASWTARRSLSLSPSLSFSTANRTRSIWIESPFSQKGRLDPHSSRRILRTSASSSRGNNSSTRFSVSALNSYPVIATCARAAF